MRRLLLFLPLVFLIACTPAAPANDRTETGTPVASSSSSAASVTWETYENKVVGYRMQVPASSASPMASNTFAVWDGACAVDGGLGPLTIWIYEREGERNDPTLNPQQKEQLLLPLQKRVQAIWEQNRAERTAEKDVGPIETLTVNGQEAYRFWVTGSYGDALRGWVTERKQYQVFFDKKGLLFHLDYPFQEEAAVETMLRSWQDVPPSFTGPTLYDAAKACQKARM